MRLPAVFIGLVFLTTSVACQSGRHSNFGFRLPPGGDAERGKTAFVAHQCHTCHQVSGVDLPKPTAQPSVPVVLGGSVIAPKADGYLVTSIVYPSYQLVGYPKEQVAEDGQSRMPAHGGLTVQELTDIVEFLQAHYEVRDTQPYFHY